MQFNVYIHYNDTGEEELWDTASAEQEVERILLELEIEDERAAENGVPVCNCTYIVKKVKE